MLAKIWKYKNLKNNLIWKYKNYTVWLVVGGFFLGRRSWVVWVERNSEDVGMELMGSNLDDRH